MHTWVLNDVCVWSFLDSGDLFTESLLVYLSPMFILRKWWTAFPLYVYVDCLLLHNRIVLGLPSFWLLLFSTSIRVLRRLNLHPLSCRICFLWSDFVFQWKSVNAISLQKRREEMERLEKERQAEVRSYKGLMVAEKMTSNKQIASESKSLQELEEDFM